MPPKESSQLAVPVTADADLIQNPGTQAESVELLPPNASDDEGRPAYEMESVLDKRKLNGHVQYLVKFRGYQAPEWCWDEDIFGRDLIEKFEKGRRANGEATRSRRSREHSTRKRVAEQQIAKAKEGSTVPPRRSERVAQMSGAVASLHAVSLPLFP